MRSQKIQCLVRTCFRMDGTFFLYHHSAERDKRAGVPFYKGGDQSSLSNSIILHFSVHILGNMDPPPLPL